MGKRKHTWMRKLNDPSESDINHYYKCEICGRVALPTDGTDVYESICIKPKKYWKDKDVEAQANAILKSIHKKDG